MEESADTKQFSTWTGDTDIGVISPPYFRVGQGGNLMTSRAPLFLESYSRHIIVNFLVLFHRGQVQGNGRRGFTIGYRLCLLLHGRTDMVREGDYIALCFFFLLGFFIYLYSLASRQTDERSQPTNPRANSPAINEGHS